MKRVVPKSHKVKIEFLKGIGIKELIIGLFFFMLIVFVMLSDMPFNIYISVFLFSFALILLYDIDGEKGYMLLYSMIIYQLENKVYLKKRENKTDANEKKRKTSKNNYFTNDLLQIKSLDDEFVHLRSGESAFVVEISQVAFTFLSQGEKLNYIERVYAKVLRALSINQRMQVTKIVLPKNFDKYITAELNKEKYAIESFKRGLLTEDELSIRDYVINEKVKFYKEKNEKSLVYEPHYYMVVTGGSEKNLSELKSMIIQVFSSNRMSVKKCDKYDTAVFLKANFHPFFNPKDVYKCHSEEELLDWIMPNSVKFSSREYVVDGVYCYGFRIGELPVSVDDAWASSICSIPDTKLTFNIKPLERSKSIRLIDNSIDELRERTSNNVKASKYLDTQQHISALVGVQKVLQSARESFFDVNIYMNAYDYERSVFDKMPVEIRKARSDYSSTLRRDTLYRIKEMGFVVTDSSFKQKNILISSNLNEKDYFHKKAVGMYGALVAASFPFISQKISDIGGSNIGYIEGSPAIFNFFKRDGKHVNSNMMVIGKSGSGKSYFTKVLLANLASDNSKVFVLDPENEYGSLTDNFGGKSINLANSKDGRINPFQVVKVIGDSDSFDEDEDVKQCVSQHLQFLESFFAIVFKGLPSEVFEILNNFVKMLYEKNSKISRCKSIDELKPEDFPIFDDLYELVLSEQKKTKNMRYKENLTLLLSYVDKFAKDGRNSDIWNGYSKISLSENLITFNYQHLLMNTNISITNAQMLLVIHWLNNEIINNRYYNLRNGLKRRIVIIIDEAHVFIDEKNPIALDFMYNLAKRIRKYDGMQVVITQNVKDFVGSEELSRKSAAIINASQYSFIFSLAPDDLNDLCTLYEKAGGLSKFEQSIIVNNELGEAFYISAPTERGTVKIVAPREIESVFDEK